MGLMQQPPVIVLCNNLEQFGRRNTTAIYVILQNNLYCYKILHSHINVNTLNAFVSNFSITHGYNYKLIKQLPFSNKSVNMYLELLTVGTLYLKILLIIELLINLSFH